MPNGISCAYFAARNYVYGTKEQNIFKEGIAGAQTVRTVDAVTSSLPVLEPVKSFFSTVASIARKIVYPLIIGSGIYNTVKSKDKVKTGASQATGIGCMYCFEKIAEKGLSYIDKALKNKEFFQNHKAARICWYILKGAAFAASSLFGYETGNKTAGKIVDKIRSNKNNKTEKTEPIVKESIEGDIFSDMKL